MTLGVAHGHYLRSFLETLFGFCQRRPARVLAVSFGSVQSLGPDGVFLPRQPEYVFMAVLNKGQRLGPLEVHWFKEDGTEGSIDGEPTFGVVDPAVAEIRDFEDGKYVVGLAAGTTEVFVDGDADKTADVRIIHLAGLAIVNDPADEVTRDELNLGAVSDVPA